ncbi:MAG: glycosyltransferase family 39 protein [Deltaproteobacteria bacterium]|nr:MAG: glycosyltransferase family 39 protein [Deltaproteobacteria bacterium]
MDNRKDKHVDQHLFIFILCMAIPFVLYLNRHLDDNRLTSWSWAFDATNLYTFCFLLIMVLGLAWLLSLATFYEKRKGLVLFIVSFVMSSAFWSEPEVIVDASRYFTQAKHLQVYGIGYYFEQWGKAIFAWTDLPLVPFLYGMVIKLFGEQRIFFQALNSLFYALTVVLTYQLGKTLWDEDLGYWGGLLLLGFPYLYTQIPLMLVDVPTMFFLMLAIVSCVNAFEKGGLGRIVLAAVTLALVFYAKYSTWMLLSIIPVIYAYFIIRNPVRTIRRGIVLALVALFIVGVLFLIYKDVLLPQINFLIEYQKPGLTRWSESYISTFFYQVHPLVTAAAVFSFFAAARKMDFKFIIVSFLLLLFLFMQVKRIRYTIPVFPMLALMAAYGMREIQNKKLAKQVIFSVVGTSFIIAFTGFLPFLKTLGVQNLQAAGHYLDKIPGANIEVVSLGSDNGVVNPATAVPVLDIYTNKNIVYDYEPVGPEVLERVKSAPLRFTWEFPMPEYYSVNDGTEKIDALVIISDDPEHIMPEGMENRKLPYPFQKIFKQSSNIFQHQTFVTVYHK